MPSWTTPGPLTTPEGNTKRTLGPSLDRETSPFGMALHHIGHPFEEPIVEDQPLSTSSYGMAFDHFEEPIVEDQPLSTSPFGMAFDHFGEPIVEDQPLSTSPFGKAFGILLGRSLEENRG